MHTNSSAAGSFAAVELPAAGSFAAVELLNRRPSSSGVLFCILLSLTSLLFSILDLLLLRRFLTLKVSVLST